MITTAVASSFVFHYSITGRLPFQLTSTLLHGFSIGRDLALSIPVSLVSLGVCPTCFQVSRFQTQGAASPPAVREFSRSCTD